MVLMIGKIKGYIYYACNLRLEILKYLKVKLNVKTNSEM